MWSTPEKPIPKYQIIEEHLRVLERAADECLEFDPRRNEVYEALGYLQDQCCNRSGFKMYREGLEGHPIKLKQGAMLIRKHLGF